MEAQEGGNGINTPYFVKDGISYWLMTQKYSEEARIIVCDCFAEGEVIFSICLVFLKRKLALFSPSCGKNQLTMDFL